jgi:hypothetical protein
MNAEADAMCGSGCDRALLLVGFFAALRRSELAGSEGICPLTARSTSGNLLWIEAQWQPHTCRPDSARSQ